MLDYYAYVLIDENRANRVWLHVYRWFEFLYKQHLADKAFKFIPTLFEDRQIVRKGWFLDLNSFNNFDT